MILAKIYFIKQYTKSLANTFLFTVALIFILDLAEVMKNSTGDILLMTTYKSSKNIIHLMPLVILIGTIITFSNLSKKNELVIFTTLALPKSFFLTIMSAILSLVFVLIVLIFIPINAKLSIMTDRVDDRISFQEDGILFRASNDTFVRAARIDSSKLDKITVWQLDKELNLHSVISADTGSIKMGQLLLENPMVYKKLSQVQTDELIIQVDISAQEIMSNILKPDQMSLLHIPQFIQMVKKLGFSTTQHERYFWDKATLFINYYIMGLVGFIGSFSLIGRLAKKEKIFYGIVSGLGVFFTQDLIITMLPYPIGISVVLAKIILFSTVAYIWKKILIKI